MKKKNEGEAISQPHFLLELVRVQYLQNFEYSLLTAVKENGKGLNHYITSTDAERLRIALPKTFQAILQLRTPVAAPLTPQTRPYEP